MMKLIKFRSLKIKPLLLLFELFFIILLIGLDLFSKEYIYGPIAIGQKNGYTVIDKLLAFTAVENTGASFGIFKDKAIALGILSVIITIIVYFVSVVTSGFEKSKLLRCALVLIIAGGIGNVIDRFLLGYVRDFIYFLFFDFPVFNVADSFLTLGCIMLLIYAIKLLFKPVKPTLISNE